MRYEDASLSGSFQDQGPIARDDADQLEAGDRGPATGNVISGAGTDTGAAGADAAAAGARITAVAGAGGNDSGFEGGRLRVEGEHGSLSLTARGDYTYTAKAGVPENSRDTFTYTLADAGGATSRARLTIEIGKTQAVVDANAKRVVPGPDGVVVLPAGVELSDVRIVGRDLLIMLPDGTQMLIVDGAVFVPQLVINDLEVPSSNLAALLIDQEPRPASGVPQSGGGNFIETVGPLDPGTPLGDLLPPTELDYIPPEFNDVGVEEDREPEVGANPLIQLDDDARPGGNAGGTGDDPDSVNASGTLSGSGGDGPLTFSLSTAGAPAGFTYVAGPNGSLLVQQNGVTVVTVSLNAQTGAYTVTQNAPINHATGENENNVLFTFGYTVTDQDGDSATGSFQLNVDDDTPVLTGAAGGAGVTLDETAALTSAGFPISATSASAVITGTNLSYGADGAAANGGATYGIAVAGGGTTTLKTAQGDHSISLVQTSPTVITGAYNDGTGAKTAFTITIGTDGKLTVQQSVPLEHNVDGTTAAAYDDSLDLSGLINATVTVRDSDGDTATASAGIGNLIVFKDDGPNSSLAVELPKVVLTLDETQPVGSDTEQGGSPTGLATVSAGFASSFAAVAYGADGAGSTAYSLVLTGTNVASGLYALQAGDTTTSDNDPLGRGDQIVLNRSGNTITGSVGEVAYFTISIDPATGIVTFTQLQPVWNPSGGASYDEAAILNVATGALVVRQTVTDSDGDSDSSDRDIGQGIFQIQDDGPVARNDADALAAGTYGPETGNVISGAGTTGGNAGADTVGRDGASVVAVSAGEASDSSFDENGNLVISGQYGQLTIKADGSYSYARFAGTPGGVTDSFTYTLRDTDGDTSSAVLTISIGNLPPTLDAPDADAPGTVVYEAALGGTPEGSSEEAAQGANGDPRETTTGIITFSQGDGPATITIAGVEVTGVNQVIDTGEGLLTITAQTGTSISYSYTLKDNILAPGTSSTDTISVVVTDQDGQSATDTLVITIVDDQPDARNDTDSLAAGSYGPETGNVITGTGTITNDLGKDTVGADGATVVTVTSNNVPGNSPAVTNGEIVIAGQYGSLTIQADGSYSYVRAPGTPGGVTDVFTYTLQDGDGDQDTALLTIQIGNRAPEVDAPDADGDGTVVYEAGLSGSRDAGESEGSGEEAAQGADGDPREATSGTISFDQGDGPAIITIDGIVVTGANQVIDTGLGLLTINSLAAGSLSYTYVLKDNVVLNGDASDSIVVVVTDQDGQSASDTLTIRIVDDAPDASNDVDSVGNTTGPATGNLITAVDVANGDSNASDGVRDVQGADGASVVRIASNNVTANVDGGADENGNLVVNGQYGTLTVNANGSYSYVRFDGTPLTATETFTYTLRDADGDSDNATLTISITDQGVTTDIPVAGGPTTTVFEKGLADRNNGEPAGSGEIADGNGGNNSDPSELVTGSFTFEAKDGWQSVTIGGVTFTPSTNFPLGVGQANTPGALVITGITYDPATAQGVVSYFFALGDNTSGNQAVDGGDTNASFSVVVTDSDGDTSSGNLVIKIVDDAPDAKNDADALAAGSYGPETGNVISGAGTTSGAAGRDVVGADNATVVAIAGAGGSDDGFDANGNLVVSGQHGVLTIKADGSYSYARNPGTPGGVTDSFTYTLRDGDGDVDTATLTISIGNAGPTIDAPDAGAPGTIVFEKGLSGTRGANESEGSGEELTLGADSDPSEATTGTITFNQGDGPATIRIDNVVVTGINQVIDTGEGLIRVTSIASGSIGYEYVLKDNLLGNQAVNGGNFSDSISVTITDQDGQVASDTLIVTIVDDAPIARSESDSVGNTTGPATGNVITGVDVAGGDDNGSDGVADTRGADGASVVAVASLGLPFNADSQFDENGNLVVNGQYGALTIKADGSYSYTRFDGTPLTATDAFSYKLQDGDGDQATATLTISITDRGVTTEVTPAGLAGTIVHEAALGARGAGESQGSVEGATPGADDDTREATSGSLAFTAQDGLGSITIGGQTFTLSSTLPSGPLTVDKGTLVVNGISFDPVTGRGSLSYTYTLADNTLGDPSSATIPFTVTDVDGDQSSNNLVIAIVDDAPTAANDVDSVGNTTGPATGNLITGGDIAGGDVNSLDGTADVQGADGASVVRIGSVALPLNSDTGFDANGNLEVQGQYGTLLVKADGSYSYTRFNSAPLTGNDVFTYTNRDGDGDEAIATLTINIADAPVTTTIPAANGATTTVYEAALGARPSEPEGSGEEAAAGADGDMREAVSGSIGFTAPDGYSSLSLGGTLITGNFPQTVSSNDTGTLVVTGVTFNQVTGLGSISYTYTLIDNTDGAAPPASGDTSQSFALLVTDNDGDSSGGNLVIAIVDDAPVARADTDDTVEGGTTIGNVIAGTGTESGIAGKDTEGADGAVVVGVKAGGDTSSPASGNVSTQITGQYGKLTLNADGSYSYTANPNSVTAGQQDVFTYTIRDGDGDLSTTTLTITVDNVTLPADNQTKSVNEAALDLVQDPGDLAAGNATGSNSTSGAETVTGQLAVTGAISYTLNGSTNGANGVLQLSSNGSYTYTLTSPFTTNPAANDGAVPTGTNVFTYTATDANGNTVQGTITISIVDDVPTARTDVDTIAAGTFGPETGNVITGVDTTSGAAGADTRGADGASVVGVQAGTNGTAIATGVAQVIQGQYGKLTLNADGSYSYTRDQDTAGGVTDIFSYTLRDGDGDTSVTQLNIVIEDTPVTIDIPPAGGATTTVFEKGLANRGSEPAGSGEAADGDGTDNDDMSESVSGVIDFVSKDGLQGISLGNVALNLSGNYPQTITTAGGQILVVTDVTYNPATGVGSISYTYTLTDNTPGNQAVNGGDTSASFAVVVTDKDGDTSPVGNLVITIKDDAPTANNDSDSVGNTTGPATGNLITGVDNAGGDLNGSDGVADVQGADGASVISLASINQLLNSDAAFDANGNLEVQGQHGTLLVKADGSYSYTRTNGAPLTGNDVFTYAIRDGDGDQATATLTISINDRGVTTEVTPAGQAGTIVFEEALGARGAGESQGSVEGATIGANDDPRESTMGSLGFTAQDGFASITIGGQTFTLTSMFPSSPLAVDKGTLVVTGMTYNAVTGVGSVSYTYTLADNTLTDPSSATIPFTVTDVDGDQSSNNLVITIVDDAPTANDDAFEILEGNPDNAITFDVDTNDVPGADGTASRPFTTLEGTYGTLTLNADGTQTYTLNANGIAAINGLAPNATLTDKFNYTLNDGDGDNDPAEVVVTLRGTDDLPLITDLTPAAQGGDAVVDEDDLPFGSDTNKESLTTTGAFKIAAPDGIDDLTVGGIQVFVNGVFQANASGTTPLGNTITFTGYNATTGEVSYEYTLLAREAHDTGAGENDLFDNMTVTLTDTDQDVATNTLSIRIIDDVPTANNDGDRVTEGLGNVADGNVLTGSGGTDTNVFDGTADVVGADTPGTIVGARTGLEASGGAFTTVPAGAGGVVIVGTYGDLTIRADGSYSYQLKTASIPTNVTSESFSYQLRDADGDVDVAQLVIALDQDLRIPAVGGDSRTVFEDGLADGVQHGANSETVLGSFTVDLKGESGSVTIGGVAVTNNAVFDTGEGLLTITGVSTTGTVTTYSYSYTLKAALIHSGAGEINPISDVVTVSVTDATGDSASGTVTIGIVDDVPIAANDTDSVVEGAGNKADGNVLSGAGGTDANDTDGAADNVGADLPGTVIGIRAGQDTDAAPAYTAVPGGGVTINGTYGTLQIAANGSYTYTVTAASVPVGASETFVYQLRDNDGDIDIAELNIAINQDARIPTVTGDVRTVFEDGLADGVQHGTNSETVTGSFAVDLKGESGSVTINGVAVTNNAVFDTGEGLLTITGVSTSGNVTTYSYTYTLKAALTHGGQGEINPINDVVTISVTDATGDSGSGTVTIGIVDDVPLVTTAGAQPTLTADDTTLNVNPSTSFAGAFGLNYGADGQAASGALVYQLGVVGGPSGVMDTLTGQAVNLSVNVSGQVEGRTATSNDLVFVISVDANGLVTLDQQRAVKHNDPLDPQESGTSAVFLSADNLITLTATIKDGDGDTAIGTIDIGRNFSFLDDGPTPVSPEAANLTNGAGGSDTGAIDFGDVLGIANNVGNDGGTAQFSSNLASYPTGLTSGGQPITFAVTNNGQLLTASTSAGTVFTATITGSTYSIQMVKAVDSLTNVQFTDANYDFIGGNKAWFGIVPTGEVDNPNNANDSKDVLITPIGGQSVNTSGILGGVDTGQSVDPGEGFRLDYVVDLRGSPPNNYTQNAQNGHVFDTHWNTNGASVSFRQSTGTTLKFEVFDDDTNAGNTNQLVGDGVEDTVTGIVITYNGVSSILLTPTASVQPITVAGRTFTYVLDANGKGVIITNIGGATGNSGPPETTVSIFTSSGYSSMEVEYVSGADIKFSGFGAAVPSTAPVSFNLPIVIVDGDGDSSASSNLAVTLTTPPSSSSSSSSSSLMMTSSLSASSSSGTIKTDNANNNFALVGALAAGLAAPAAASSDLVGSPSFGGTSSAIDSPSLQGLAADFVSSPAAKLLDIDGLDANLNGLGDGIAAGDHRTGGWMDQDGLALDSSDLGSAPDFMTDLGTELVLPAGTDAASLIAGGGEIHLPSPDQMALIAGLQNGLEPVQHNPSLGQVLVDALSGGGAADLSVDQLIDAAIRLAEPVQGNPGFEDGAIGGGSGIADLATQLSHDVPGWDGGQFSPLFQLQGAALESPALHPDAVQPMANG